MIKFYSYCLEGLCWVNLPILRSFPWNSDLKEVCCQWELPGLGSKSLIGSCIQGIRDHDTWACSLAEGTQRWVLTSQSMCGLSDSSSPLRWTSPWEASPESCLEEWVLYFLLQQIAIQQEYLPSKQTFFWSASKTILVNCFPSTFYFIKSMLLNKHFTLYNICPRV